MMYIDNISHTFTIMHNVNWHKSPRKSYGIYLSALQSHCFCHMGYTHHT